MMKRTGKRILTGLLAAVLAAGLLTGCGSKTEKDSTGNTYDPAAFPLNDQSAANLTETADAGADYLNGTVFVGSGITLSFASSGLLSLDRVAAFEGVSVTNILTQPGIAFVNDPNGYTVPQAIAMMKPQRVIVTMGSFDANGSMTNDDFISLYSNALAGIKTAYPYAEIIVNTIPPVPELHSQNPGLNNQTIDEFNQSLQQMCETQGYKFLNSAFALKGEDGFGRSEYFEDGSAYLNRTGCAAFLDYVCKHASATADSRPDTANIPQRAATVANTEVVSVDHEAAAGEDQQNMPAKDNSAPAAGANDAKSSTGQSASYTAVYTAQQGGTLASGSLSGKRSFKFGVKSNSAVSVVAVPSNGYQFTGWSDGITSASRTDKGFTGSTSLTAQFSKINQLAVSLSNSSMTIGQGANVTITAYVNGGDANQVAWTGDAPRTGSSYNLSGLKPGYYVLTATITVDGVSADAKANITVVAPSATPTPAPTPVPATPIPVVQQATPVPVVQATPAPTPVPVVQATPEPTPVPVVQATPEPTPVPVVQATPLPTPVPAITVTPATTEITVGTPLLLQAAVSGGDASSVTWLCSDGTACSGATASWTFATPGSYTITASYPGAASVNRILTVDAANPALVTGNTAPVGTGAMVAGIGNGAAVG